MDDDATEHFQRRRSYQRLNVIPWAYEDSYFIYRGDRDGVTTGTDNLMLFRGDNGYRGSGKFTTELLTLGADCFFDRLDWEGRTPAGTAIRVRILDGKGKEIAADVESGRKLHIKKNVRIEFTLSTSDKAATPTLDSYRLSFARP